MGSGASRLYVAFFSLLLGIPELHAACGPKLRQEVVALRQEFQSKVRNFFAEQSEAPYLAIGVLIELPNGEQVFSVGSYFGNSHEYLLGKHGIQVDDGKAEVDANSAGAKVLWAGELAFDKHGEVYGVEATNQTSSIYDKKFRTASGVRVEASINSKNIENYLIDLHDEDQSKPRIESYNRENPYLLDVEIPLYASIRHYMGNRHTVIISNVSSIRHYVKSGMVDLAETVDILSSNLDEFNDAVTKKVYAHLSRMHTKKNEELLDALQIIEKHQELSSQVLVKVKSKDSPTLEDLTPILNEEALSSAIDAYKKISQFIYSRFPQPETEQNTFSMSNATLIPR